MHNAITQSWKINQRLAMFQGYGLTRYRKCKTNITIPMEYGLSKEQENKKRGCMDGNPNKCFREKA